MSVEFSNAYQEILLDNLVAVIKQNFVFQTQLKLVEPSIKEKDELKKKVSELTELNEKTKSDLSQLQAYKSKSEINTSLHEEKARIQTALNEEMKKVANLKRENDQRNSLITQLKKETSELKEYIKTLEESVPVTKLKKLKTKTDTVENESTPLDETEKQPSIENKVKKVLDGSSF